MIDAAAVCEVTVDGLRASAYEVPTDEPESDGTLAWSSTTIVVVEADGGGRTGLGYTYGDAALTRIIDGKLAPVVQGRSVSDLGARSHDMSAALRNVGRPGAGMMAISAVDVALWDLKARLLGVALIEALPAAHDTVPVYGSGGFTSYSLDRIADQLGGWVADGIPRVKMKVSRDPAGDPARLDVARKAIGDATHLFVDANGALGRRPAVSWARRFHDEWAVSWFEEPVSSDDVDGLRFVRDRAPDGIEIAAGEYGFLTKDFHQMLAAGAVDCLQADVTRCGGITGVLRVAGLCEAEGVDLSAHGAPAVSAHAFCAIERLRHLEHFHDHARLEALLFDGTLSPRGGSLRPDRTRPGLGLVLKRQDAELYRVA